MRDRSIVEIVRNTTMKKKPKKLLRPKGCESFGKTMCIVKQSMTMKKTTFDETCGTF